ncbi:MAG: hypothetical protein V2A70_05110 [Candidatus Omnitrophota bacterium]
MGGITGGSPAGKSREKDCGDPAGYGRTLSFDLVVPGYEVTLAQVNMINNPDGRFAAFGINKRREMARLVAEIAKREACSPESVVDQIPLERKTYPAVKACLLARRFPEASRRGEKISEVFTSFDVDPSCALPLERTAAVPVFERIYIEASLEASALALRARGMFPRAQVQLIPDYRDYCSRVHVDIPMYNLRAQDLFIVKEKHDYFKPCPCSPGARSCGYHNVNLGFGCPFECSYCFLQNYTNAPGIVLPANIEDFFEAFRKNNKDMRVGSGEMTDSLVYDSLTGFSGQVVDFFREYPQSIFEFKTKSDNITGLLRVKASSNIVVGWSLNPQDVIDREEHFTASLDRRLDAACRCAAHGYRVAFHFDPVIYSPGWEADYADVMARVFKVVPPESIAWISIGTLRMTRTQKKIIENRFPRNTILDAELFTAQDGKLRYAQDVRLDVYSKMISWLDEKVDGSTFIYLCMEMESVWKNIQGQRSTKRRPNLLMSRNGFG